MLSLLAGPLSDGRANLSVFQVSAVVVPPPREPERPEPPPVVEEPEPEPEPEPRTRARRPPPSRRQRPEPPEPVEEPPEPVEEPPEPVEEPPEPVEERPDAPSEPVVPASPVESAPPTHRGAIASASARPGSRASASGGDGARARRRRASSHDGVSCDQVARVFARRLHATAPYPSWAEQMGLEGELVLRLRIGRDGRARGVRVSQTSGHRGLDRFALSAARRLEDLPSGCRRSFSVPVNYRLRRR